jgi:hypothetical protein
MTRTIAAIIFAAATAMIITAAKAADTEIGGVAIALPTPAGFCNLSADQPTDKRLLAGVSSAIEKSGNKLLAVSADCQQLTDWRAAKIGVLDDFAQYQTPLATMNLITAKSEIETACTQMRKQGEQIMAEVGPKAKANIEEVFNKVKVNETKLLGVLAEDPDACYVGIVAKGRTESGADKTQVVVYAITVVKGKPVLIYHYGLYARADGADTVTNLLQKTKASVAAVYAANK